MISFLKANYLTIIVLGLLVAIVALIIRKLVRDRRNGIGTCGGDCSKCHTGCTNSTAKKNMVKTTVYIDGMVCAMCESHINDVIRRSLDIKKVSSSHRAGTATIISQHRLDNNAIKKAINDTEYTVKSIDIELC